MKQTLSLTNEAYADEDIAAALSAASRWAEAFCGRRFWQDGGDTVRVFTPTRPTHVWIDDLAAVTAVKTDDDGDGTFENTWAASDYILGPLNAAADDRPWTHIRARNGGAFLFPHSYPATVQITGRFGWPSVPAEVVQATTILASRYLKRSREAPFGLATIGFEGGTARLAKTDPDAASLLQPLRRATDLH